MRTGRTRGTTAIVAALLIAGTSATSAVAAPRNAFTGDFELILPATGQVLGRTKAQLSPPTPQRLVAGIQDFKGTDASAFAETHGQWARTEFWHDPNHPFPGSGGSNVAFGEGMDCLYLGEPNDGVCVPSAVMYIDVLDPSLPDQVAYAERDPATGEWDFKHWLEVGNGEFSLRFAGS